MERLTLGEILTAVGGTLLGDARDLDLTVDRVETDSRTIHAGSLFVPLTGERFDGHAYINAALEGGAAGCLTVRERASYLPGKFYVKVGSTMRALRDLAAYYRDKFDVPVIGITGSVGKTTAKEMTAAVLGTKYEVLKTEGNLNSRVGLPLTVLNLERRHQVCVLEMGMNQPGEIDYLSQIARPDIAVITNVGDAHIENLGSRENILKAKSEIFPNVRPGGLAVLNADDELLCGLRGKLDMDTVFCGRSAQADYRATQVQSDGDHILCRAHTPGGEFSLEIPAPGQHMIYPALIATAVGERLGLTREEIAKGILQFRPTKMRMNVLRRAQGITILNDAYNANPQSMRAAISVLSDDRSSFKLAVLGDMFELGSLAPALHAGVGEVLGKAKIDCLIAVGELSAHMAEAARNAGVATVIHCPDKQGAKAAIAEQLRPDSTVLVKASRGMAMEELVDELLKLTQAEQEEK